MFTQILTAALVLGILIIIGKVLRNRYLGKPHEFDILTLLSYILVSVPCFGFVLINGVNFIGDDEAYTCVAVISLFTPVVLDYVFTLLVEKVLSSNRSGNILKKRKSPDGDSRFFLLDPLLNPPPLRGRKK